jgi:hypothetical protein
MQTPQLKRKLFLISLITQLDISTDIVNKQPQLQRDKKQKK